MIFNYKLQVLSGVCKTTAYTYPDPSNGTFDTFFTFKKLSRACVVHQRVASRSDLPLNEQIDAPADMKKQLLNLIDKNYWEKENPPFPTDIDESGYQEYSFKIIISNKRASKQFFFVHRAQPLLTPIYLLVDKEKSNLPLREQLDVHDEPICYLHFKCGVDSYWKFSYLFKYLCPSKLEKCEKVQLNVRPSHLPQDRLCEFTNEDTHKNASYLPFYDWHYTNFRIDGYLYNRKLVHLFLAHWQALELCIALVPYLPPYTLLEIVRHLEWFDKMGETRFARLAANVQSTHNLLKSDNPTWRQPHIKKREPEPIFALVPKSQTSGTHFLCEDPLISIGANQYQNLRDNSTFFVDQLPDTEHILQLPQLPLYMHGDEIGEKNGDGDIVYTKVKLTWQKDHFEYS